MKHKATGMIHMYVSYEVMYYILDLTYSNEVYEKLESHNMGKMFMDKLFAKQQLYMLKIQNGYNLQHFNTFNRIIPDLVRLGVTIDDEDKAVLINRFVRSPSDNSTFGKNFIKLDDIIVALHSHSQRRQNVKEGSLGEVLCVNKSQDCGRYRGKAERKYLNPRTEKY